MNKSDDDDEEAEADFEAYTSPRYDDILIIHLFYLFTLLLYSFILLLINLFNYSFNYELLVYFIFNYLFIN